MLGHHDPAKVRRPRSAKNRALDCAAHISAEMQQAMDDVKAYHLERLAKALGLSLKMQMYPHECGSFGFYSDGQGMVCCARCQDLYELVKPVGEPRL